MSQEKTDALLREVRALLEEVRASVAIPRAVELKEAARLLSVSTRHISRMIRRGELLTSSVGGVRRIPMDEINRLASPPLAKSNSAPETAERVRYDQAEASRKLKELRSKKR